MNNIYPIRLKGIDKETIWGGNKINSSFGGATDKKIGERWILSARENDDCEILNGKFKGMTLTGYLERTVPDLLPFPMLIKFIDAHDRLSVQVHPDDLTAKQFGDDTVGKTEMWHILDAEEGATIVYGVKHGIDRAALRLAVSEGRVESVLNYLPVKAGDTFFIPAGLVHAIGKGILLAEVQQNSDTTYRFYDYGRLDASGNPRQLHVEKAIGAYKPTDEVAPECPTDKNAPCDALVSCEYFNVRRCEIKGSKCISLDGVAFCSVVCIKGNAILEYDGGVENISPGDSFFLPQGLGSVIVNGEAVLLISGR